MHNRSNDPTDNRLPITYLLLLLIRRHCWISSSETPIGETAVIQIYVMLSHNIYVMGLRIVDSYICHTMQLDCHTIQLDCHTMQLDAFGLPYDAIRYN